MRANKEILEIRNDSGKHVEAMKSKPVEEQCSLEKTKFVSIK